ncbi:diguanylate cyclase [Agathobacter sp.]
MDKRKEIIKYRFEDPQKAYDICLELLEQGKQSGNDYEIAYAYLYMGDTLFSMGKIDEALENLSIAERVQKQNSFNDLLMKTYNIIGIIYANMGDALFSMDYYHLALKLAEKYDNYTLAAMVYNNIGALLMKIGDTTKAAEYYKMSYDKCMKKGNDDDLKFNMIEFHINVFIGLLNEKRYGEARACIDDAVKSMNFDKLSESDKAKIVHAYAMIYYRTGEYEKSYQMCLKVIELWNKEWKDVELFDDYYDIAEIMVDMDSIEYMHDLLDTLDRMAEQTDIDNRRLKLCQLRIQIYKKTGEKAKLKEELHNYYRIRQKRNAQRNDIIISAIDNRCRLEAERKQNKLLNENNMKLVKESEIDDLTGIYNRFAFKRRYDKLYRYALKNGYTYCVGIFDIDCFKQYNDSYGHLQGDECLKLVARILRRTSDGDFCVARYGGDEFVFMAYDVTEENVRSFLRRLVENVKNEKIQFQADKDVDSDRVTISVGATIQQRAAEGTELIVLLKQADKVLYEVKQAGKDGYKVRTEL